MSVEIRMEGIEEILEKLEECFDTETMRKAIGQACSIVEAEAKKKAPKGDGALRRSITSKVEAEGGNVIGTVFTPLEYAPYVEYGTGLFAEEQGRTDVPWSYQDDKGEWHSTSGMKPQPFMRPALNENREAIKQKIKEGMTK